MQLDAEGWSGEGTFTHVLIDALRTLPRVRAVRVEDAPASRAESGFSFISNELYVTFDAGRRLPPAVKLRVPSAGAEVTGTNLASLESALERVAEIGAPDYSDAGMLQYLRTERVVPPYQTRGVKIVELVRIYEAAWTAESR